MMAGVEQDRTAGSTDSAQSSCCHTCCRRSQATNQASPSGWNAGRDPLMDRPGGISRGYATWLLYLVFSCMAFLLNGLGAVLAPLQKELGVTRAEVAFYPSLFAVGLLVVGLAGGSFVSRIGRVAALRLSVAGMMLGGLLIAAPSRVATLLGALVLGLGAALLIQLVPAVLSVMHPGRPAATIGEANGLASGARTDAALAAGLGWRAGYLVAPLV